MKFQDYYQTLEVNRTATPEELSKAFRRLARKYHPDVNKGQEAEEKFKQINEAYEVLKDPEKRARYDQLGPNWKAGQDFNPPPGWENVFEQYLRSAQQGKASGANGRRQRKEAQFDGFSDFFDALFGAEGAEYGRGPMRARRDGATLNSKITISLEDAYHGATKSVSVPVTELGTGGLAKFVNRNFNIKIPPGTTEGKIIRLKGMGSKGSGGGEDGDLLMTVHIAPHPRMRIERNNIIYSLPVSPWEAALGTKVQFTSLDGELSLNIPQGSQNGTRLRLKDRGISAKDSSNAAKGDLFVELKIQLPSQLTAEEREHFEALAKVSSFNPRE